MACFGADDRHVLMHFGRQHRAWAWHMFIVNTLGCVSQECTYCVQGHGCRVLIHEHVLTAGKCAWMAGHGGMARDLDAFGWLRHGGCT